MKRFIFFFFSCIASFGLSAQNAFTHGADVSWCTEMEADGRTFYNASGNKTDIFALMREVGMTAIRLRVWVNPSLYGYGAWCDKADVLNKARRAHEQGLDLMIDFHYSDFFADPGRQDIPLDWLNYDADALKMAISDHTHDVLQALKDEGIEPRWVQVGNETNSGMLHPLGQINWELSGAARFTNYVALSNTGYDAVKEVFPQAQVIIHLGGAVQAQWFFPDFIAAGGKVDMIGLSHYPTAEEWNSSSTDATQSNINAAMYVQSAIQQFHLPVMICETGFDVNRPALAKQVMQDLFDRMTAIPQCVGIFYWEPEVDGSWKPTYYTTLGWNAYGLGAFTVNGKPTSALDPFKSPNQAFEQTTSNEPNNQSFTFSVTGQLVPGSQNSLIIRNGKKMLKMKF